MSLPQSPSSLASVGGAIQNAIQPVNPLTDLDAAYGNISRMECAMMTQTCIQAIVPIEDGYVGDNYRALWKANLSNTAPEVEIDSGSFLITFPQTVLDELGNTKSLNFLFAHAQVTENWDTHEALAEVVNSYTVRVRLYELTAGAKVATTEGNFCVWIH